MPEEVAAQPYTPARRPKPRSVLNTSASNYGLWAGIIVIVVGLWLIVVQADSLRSERADYADLMAGPIIEGTVLDKRIVTDSDSDPQSGATTHVTRYTFTYQYHVGARQLTGEQSDVSQQTYDQLKIGSGVSVRYAPSMPVLSCIPNQCIRQPTDGLLTFTYLLPLIGLVLVWRGWRRERKVRLFVLHGAVTIATIVDRWTTESHDSDTGSTTHYCIAYQFEAQRPDGRSQRVTRSEYNQAAYEQCAIGDRFPIRFLPTDPQICQLEGSW